MVKFSTMKMEGDKLTEVSSREISQSDIMACPHYILVPEHYRADGSCKCNDPTAIEMKEWGYTWNGTKWL